MSWVEIAHWVFYRFEWLILAYFLFVNTMYLVLLISAWAAMLEHRRVVKGEFRWKLLGSSQIPRISVLAPAYNEGATIADSLHAFLTLNYPNLEIILVNDGSKDKTMEVIKDNFDLTSIHPIYQRRIETKAVRALYASRRYPNLVVLDKENGGKADALNAALNLATGQLVCVVDSDTLIEADALLRMVRPFLMGENVLAVGGTIRVANGSRVEGGRVTAPRMPRSALAGFQVVEYLRSFLFGRLGWNKMAGNLIISGAFGLFRRDSVIAIGGYAHHTVGEDMEIVARLRRHGYENKDANKVIFIPDPVAWTEVPESPRVLARQRDRWHRGLAEVLWRHRQVMFNYKYGGLGLLVFPFFVLVELVAPVIEAIGVLGCVAGWLLGAMNVPFAICFFLFAYGYGTLLSMFVLLMEEWSYHRYDTLRDRLLLLLWASLENLGYRQLTVWWRLKGLAGFLSGRKTWGHMERKGFQTQPPTNARAAAKLKPHIFFQK
ncbi:MAG TPA: glycosyltransferase [Candidatus Angelobacter sp.]|nr:glycosyltransferase [Candidatus Angelobacter sp.]